jgi:cytochrome c556
MGARPLVLLIGLLAVAPAPAQFARPELAVKYRQSVMFLMGNHLQRIKAELEVSKPDLARVRASTGLLEQLKTLPFEAFVPGTESIENSAAEPEVWSEAVRFRELAGQMQERVGALDAAARAGDVAALRTAFVQAGKACKRCHDDFRRQP